MNNKLININMYFIDVLKEDLDNDNKYLTFKKHYID